MNKNNLKNAFGMIDESLVEEAIEYNSENISESSEIFTADEEETAVVHNKNSIEIKSVISCISAVAAIVLVFVFVLNKNGEPDNNYTSVVTQCTTTECLTDISETSAFSETTLIPETSTVTSLGTSSVFKTTTVYETADSSVAITETQTVTEKVTEPERVNETESIVQSDTTDSVYSEETEEITTVTTKEYVAPPDVNHPTGRAGISFGNYNDIVFAGDIISDGQYDVTWNTENNDIFNSSNVLRLHLKSNEPYVFGKKGEFSLHIDEIWIDGVKTECEVNENPGYVWLSDSYYGRDDVADVFLTLRYINSLAGSFDYINMEIHESIRIVFTVSGITGEVPQQYYKGYGNALN